MYSDARLTYRVQADSLEEALSTANGYDVTDANRCCGEDMEDIYDIVVELDADDLEQLLGKPGKGGPSFQEAQKRAQRVEKDRQERSTGVY